MPSVQFFSLLPTFPCSAPQLQAIINNCMSSSDPVAPGKKYLQNATLNFLPEASWAVPRPLSQRSASASAAAAAAPPSPSIMVPSPVSLPLVMVQASSPAANQPAAGFVSPRQLPPLSIPSPHSLLLYVEILPYRKPASASLLEVTK